MSNRDGFTSGLLFGAIVGGIVGAATGFLLSRPSRQESLAEKEEGDGDRRSIPNAKAESLDFARESLEDKIVQLNNAIDEVRQQLHGVSGNGSSTEPKRESDR